MLAEYIIAMLLVAFCVGWLVGYQGGRRQERIAARLRVERIRGFYIGGMRDW